MNDDVFSGQPGTNSLTAVLVPTIRSEISDLLNLFFIWGGYAQLAHTVDLPELTCRLIVTFDCDYNRALEEKVHRSFDSLGLSRVFKCAKVFFCDIQPAENLYVRPGQVPPQDIPKLGLKSGPNIQFFKSVFEYCAEENVVLLNEVDCFPTTRHWLHRLHHLVAGSEPFWILGSPYRGYGKLGPEITSHVNGNALYGVGTGGFKDVLATYWRDGLVEAVSKNPDIAYDIFLNYSHHAIMEPTKWNSVSLEKFRFYTSLLCKVRHTDLIHNLAGTAESSGNVKINFMDYVAANPAATLIHGKHLADQVLQNLFIEFSMQPNERTHEWLTNAVRFLYEINERALAKFLTDGIEKSKTYYA